MKSFAVVLLVICAAIHEMPPVTHAPAPGK